MNTELLTITQKIQEFIEAHSGLSKNFIYRSALLQDPTPGKIYKIIISLETPEDHILSDQDLAIMIDMDYTNINFIQSNAWINPTIAISIDDVKQLIKIIKSAIIFNEILKDYF